LFRRGALGQDESRLLDGARRETTLHTVDASLLENLISKNQPLRIETASERVFDVRHPDFVSFSPRKTSVLIWCEENGEEHFAIVPLLAVTAAMTKA
jgi:hypothetical protein